MAIPTDLVFIFSYIYFKFYRSIHHSNCINFFRQDVDGTSSQTLIEEQKPNDVDNGICIEMQGRENAKNSGGGRNSNGTGNSNEQTYVYNFPGISSGSNLYLNCVLNILILVVILFVAFFALRPYAQSLTQRVEEANEFMKNVSVSVDITNETVSFFIETQNANYSFGWQRPSLRTEP